MVDKNNNDNGSTDVEEKIDDEHLKNWFESYEEYEEVKNTEFTEDVDPMWCVYHPPSGGLKPKISNNYLRAGFLNPKTTHAKLQLKYAVWCVENNVELSSKEDGYFSGVSLERKRGIPVTIVSMLTMSAVWGVLMILVLYTLINFV